MGRFAGEQGYEEVAFGSDPLRFLLWRRLGHSESLCRARQLSPPRPTSPRPQGWQAPHSQTSPSPHGLEFAGNIYRDLPYSRGRNPQLAESIPRLQRFRRMRVPLDQVPQFPDAVILLPQFDQCESLLQLRGSSFVPAGKIL